MSQDNLLRYLDMPVAFANRAGKLAQLLSAQNRAASKLLKGINKLPKEQQELIVLAGEIDLVAHDLLNWTKDFLQDVANDTRALNDGATLRHRLELQKEMIDRLMQQRDEWFSKTLEDLKKK